MVFFSGKRGEALTATVLIVLIVTVFLGWLITFSSKECRSNSQCKYGYYCGSDFSCHEMPVIEKTLTQNNLLMPALILGIAIVAAAFIIQSRSGARNNNHNSNHDHDGRGHADDEPKEHQQHLKMP